MMGLSISGGNSGKGRFTYVGGVVGSGDESKEKVTSSGTVNLIDATGEASASFMTSGDTS